MPSQPDRTPSAAQERDVCPNEWKVRGFVRSSHSMFHGSMHECDRDEGHKGRCKCWCGRTTGNRRTYV